jgi:Skp family chaperone for outer membrane proteins
MRLLAITLASSITLVASHTYAQAPAGQAPGPRDAEAARARTARHQPRRSRPHQRPARARAAKFQDGFKYAYVNMAAIAAQSVDGKAAAEKLKAFQDQKTRELQDKQKTLQAAQQKLESGGSVLSEAARTQLQSDIDRQQRDLQRLTEDAQQDVQNLAQQVEEDFTRKVLPIVGKVAQDKQVHFVFNAQQSGLIWAEPGWT